MLIKKFAEKKVFNLLHYCIAIIFVTLTLSVSDLAARGAQGVARPHSGSETHGGHVRHFGGSSDSGADLEHHEADRGHSNSHHLDSEHRYTKDHDHHAGSRFNHFGTGLGMPLNGNFYGGPFFDYGGYYPQHHGYGPVPRYYAPREYSYIPPLSNRYRSYNSKPYMGRGEPRPTQSVSGGRKNSYTSYSSASARYSGAGLDSYSSSEANDLGWQLLAQNNYKAALNVFTSLVGRHKDDGVAKVGYALSAALQGNLNKAAWSMRGALSIDPGSLHGMEVNSELRSSIEKLLTQYRHQVNHAQGNRLFDVAFMIAVLNYLIHEKDAARLAVEKSMDKLGDNSPSVINLQRLIAGDN